MTTQLDIELRCPNCNDLFDSKSLMSTNTFGKKTTDFYNQTYGSSPLPLLIHTCPTCGYTGNLGEFENIKIEKRIKDLIAKNITSLVKNEDIFPGRQYEYAAWIASWSGSASIEIGRLYHMAAWCCYDDGRKEKENDYRKKAIEYFTRALEKDEVKDYQIIFLSYLIGELYRRVGELENANFWFERVINVVGEDPNLQRMIKLADQQKNNPKEYIDEK
jgi:uncharacterized protein (DUF2225 family)